MPTVKLTQSFLASIEPPESGTVRIMDTEVRGLCVDVGTKSIRFYLRRQVNGKLKPVKIGEFPAMTVAQARSIAEKHNLQISSGRMAHDSVAAARIAPTLLEATDAYITFRTSTGRPMKDRTVKDIRDRVGRHLADWADTRITDIGRRAVSERHALLTQSAGPTTANRVMKWLSAILSWSSDHYAPDDDVPLLAINPVRVLRKTRQWNPENRRQTFIQSSGLPGLWAAINALPCEAKRWPTQAEAGRDYFVFLLFTGMRPGEARRLKVDSIDLRERVFVLEDSKNHSDFYLPFSEYVGELLRRRLEYSAEIGSEYVFPALGHHGESSQIRVQAFAEKIREKIGQFAPNDLRRTFNTIVNNLEPPVSHLTLKRLMNHASQNVDAGDVTAGYYVGDVEKLRVVVERITDTILRQAGASKRGRNVVKLRS